MKIEKGTVLEINHSRKGRFIATAYEDFDTKTTEWYPVNIHQPEVVKGMEASWSNGDKIPCRNILCTVKIIGRER